MRKRPSLKSIKRIPFIFLLIILSNLIITICACVGSVGKTTIIEVTTFNGKLKTYKNVDIGENMFQTGTEGKLYWKVKNIKEALLISLADREHSTNFYDLIYLLILNIALFVMVFKINENSIFSNQLYWGLRLIAASVMLYPIIKLISYKLAGYSIEVLTSGQFTAQLRNSNIIIFLILTYLFLFLAPFVKKAIDYQNENNLTI